MAKEYYGEAGEEWVDYKDTPARISARRVREASLVELINGGNSWWAGWVCRSLNGLHVRDEEGNWIDSVTPDTLTNLPTAVIGAIFQRLGDMIYTVPLAISSPSKRTTTSAAGDSQPGLLKPS